MDANSDYYTHSQKAYKLRKTEQSTTEPPLGQGKNKKEIKVFLGFSENISKPMGHYESSGKRKIQNTKCQIKDSHKQNKVSWGNSNPGSETSI